MFRIAAVLTVALALLGCESSGPISAGPASDARMGGYMQPYSGAAAASQVAAAYRLGPGDKLRVIVFQEENLSGEFNVDDIGTVSLPLIGKLDIRNMTVREFERLVTERLKDGYLQDPKVSIEILTYRPFYIHGEVTNGGEFPYKAGMSVMNAVAVAGGYTYRANTKIVYVTRDGTNYETEMPANQNMIVMPGDVIRVPERRF